MSFLFSKIKSRIDKYAVIRRYKKGYRMLTDAFVKIGLEYDFKEDKLTLLRGKEEKIDIPETVTGFHRQLRKHQLRITLTEEEFDKLCLDIEPGEAGQTEFQCGIKEGGWIWFSMIYTVVYTEGADRRPLRLFGCMIDAQKQHQEQENLEKMGQYDKLTGIYNRIGAETQIVKALEELEDYSQNAFLLMDVDWFKQMNDSCGHLCGDDVLKSLGRNIQDIFQGDTILCRWGGDEFIMFVRGPGADMRLLEMRIEELRRRMKQYQYGGIQYPVGLSIGGIIPKPGMTLKTLFLQADKVMYRVKKNGRDSFVIENAGVDCDSEAG